MTDIYRFILALCVVQGHFLASGAPWLAWQAVFSFYVLSGFLVTLVLNQQYGAPSLGSLASRSIGGFGFFLSVTSSLD